MDKKKMKKRELKAGAILTLHDAANFSADGKRRLLAWLTRCMKHLQQHNKGYAKRFRARYLYAD